MEHDARANELYWESDRSVNQIADEMELSKGMLYGMIRPLAAGVACPRCSSDMEYANRTARERGLVTCPACSLEVEQASVIASEPDPIAATASRPEPATNPWHALARRSAPRIDGRNPAVVGAGLLLIAAGIWLFRGLNRR